MSRAIANIDSKSLTRRTAVITIAAAAVPSAALPALSGYALDANAALEAAWLERSALKAAADANTKSLHAAWDRLPRWARSGPSQLNHDGSHDGPHMGWPEVKNPTLPLTDHGYSLIRISPSDVREAFRIAVANFCPDEGSRVRARARYRERMREVIARIREKREEERKVGVEAMENESECLCNAIFDVEERIREMTGVGNFNAFAALALIELEYNSPDDDGGELSYVNILVGALRTIRPQISKSRWIFDCTKNRPRSKGAKRRKA
jgi:hypothetical protein